MIKGILVTVTLLSSIGFAANAVSLEVAGAPNVKFKSLEIAGAPNVKFKPLEVAGTPNVKFKLFEIA